MRSTRILIATAVATMAAGAGAAPAAGAPQGSCTPASAPRTIAYKQISGVPANLTSLDVWAPRRSCRPGGRRSPVVLWVHGGAYQTGDKRNGVRNKVRAFNARGWVFVSVNYRLTRPGNPGSARYPDHFRDVAAAVAWTRAHISRSGGDPRRIALLGHSAGADIVSNVTTNPRWLRERRLSLRAVRCAGPLDTAGFDKTRAAHSAAQSEQWRAALGNHPGYKSDTSATLLARAGTGIPRTITVVRGTNLRRSIQTAFADALRRARVRTSVIDASSLSHAEVSRRIGAPGDTVMTPPLMRFLGRCFDRG